MILKSLRVLVVLAAIAPASASPLVWKEIVKLQAYGKFLVNGAGPVEMQCYDIGEKWCAVLDPAEAKYQRKPSDNFLKVLEASFPESKGWKREFSANALTDESLQLHSLAAQYEEFGSTVGMQIYLSYAPGKGDPTDNVYWIQVVQSNHPLPDPKNQNFGKKENIVDTRSQKGSPYYQDGYTASSRDFLDTPRRFARKDKHTWSAELFLVTGPALPEMDKITPGTLTFWGGLTYGWRTEPEKVPEPATWWLTGSAVVLAIGWQRRRSLKTALQAAGLVVLVAATAPAATITVDDPKRIILTATKDDCPKGHKKCRIDGFIDLKKTIDGKNADFTKAFDAWNATNGKDDKWKLINGGALDAVFEVGGFKVALDEINGVTVGRSTIVVGFDFKGKGNKLTDFFWVQGLYDNYELDGKIVKPRYELDVRLKDKMGKACDNADMERLCPPAYPVQTDAREFIDQPIAPFPGAIFTAWTYPALINRTDRELTIFEGIHYGFKTSAVPEPATDALIGVALIVGGLLRRRR